MNGVPGIEDGRNAFYMTVEGGHDYKTWSKCLYDFMLVMFSNIEG